MFISALEIFKVGIGPSSSHTMGPLAAAGKFRALIQDYFLHTQTSQGFRIRCTLKGSLAFTGKGHATDSAVALGVHGHTPLSLADGDAASVRAEAWSRTEVHFPNLEPIIFSPDDDIFFDYGDPLPEHPNGIIFQLIDPAGASVMEETYFSIGGGFIHSREEFQQAVAPLKFHQGKSCPYAIDSAKSLLSVARESGLSIAQIQYQNEMTYRTDQEILQGLKQIWTVMVASIERGLSTEGKLPGKLNIDRRAKMLHDQLLSQGKQISVSEWLSAYAMAVNEENASGHTIVTAPTNGAAGVIPSILYAYLNHEGGTDAQVNEFLLTAASIGAIIKRNGSLSGAEVGCQGEVGAAAAMAAAGLCAVIGGTPEQVENAAEVALEHHLGMTCDPVAGLVQVPCIERNAFGAVKAHTAASLALRGTGAHFMPLDNCIAAMKQTGLEMSSKYKETSLGGLAVSLTEC